MILDYGYGGVGFGETLQAVGGHAFTDILADPGRNDLSAHVDFAALAEAGRRGGATVYGPCRKANSWNNWAWPSARRQLVEAHPAAARDLHAALERLIAPQQMGTLFKALAFVPPATGIPPGF